MKAESNLHPSQPYWIGHRLIIMPEGVPPPNADRIPIWIKSDGIFGTGEHPTTRLCLRVLERHLPSANRVMDIGTGTGILAIAAAKLGSERVLAVDIDPDAVPVAVNNVRINGVGGQITVKQGSLEEALLEAERNGKASLVVMNIFSNVLELFFSKGLNGLLQQDGLLVLSGMLSAQTAFIRGCLQIHGFELLAQEREREWVCIIARKYPFSK